MLRQVRHTRLISDLHSRGGCQVAERDCRNRLLWVNLWVRLFLLGQVANLRATARFSLDVELLGTLLSVSWLGLDSGVR
jgi:hypothetical protein